jgi:predicted component of type VI protein secretion system
MNEAARRAVPIFDGPEDVRDYLRDLVGRYGLLRECVVDETFEADGCPGAYRAAPRRLDASRPAQSRSAAIRRAGAMARGLFRECRVGADAGAGSTSGRQLRRCVDGLIDVGRMRTTGKEAGRDGCGFRR